MISLRPAHLKRYKDILVLLAKHGRPEWARQAGAAAELEDEVTDVETRDDARELASDLEELGPTFVKLGQLLAGRSDLFPQPYLDELARLQDDVKPFDSEEVQQIVVEELGVRISKAFAEFDFEPMAAASLGQVHRARLRDGRQVVVKVQRPGIRKTVSADLEALVEIAEFLEEHTETGRRIGVHELARQFRRTILEELDYRAEAQHLERLRQALARFHRLVVPTAIRDYSSSRVLTMSYVDGTPVSKLGPLAQTELSSDGAELADELFRAYLHQTLVDGFFHADPHPGNVLLLPDRRLALLDVGQVGRLSQNLREPMLNLMLEIAGGEGVKAARTAEAMSTLTEDFEREEFERAISEMVMREHRSDMAELDVGALMLKVTRIAAENGVRVPPELSILGKAILQLEEIARTLAPRFNPSRAVQRHAPEIMKRRMETEFSSHGLLARLSEMRSLLEELPERARGVLEILSGERNVQMDVNVLGERELVTALQKVANRIAAGLVLSALIVGAALLMRVEADVRIWGYPAIALLLFLAAAVGGAKLLWDILRQDRRLQQDSERRRGN